jgi:hypothetical protein
MGLKAGVAIVALGAWAALGQLDRAWKDGSTVAVQFALPGKAALTVTCQYAPQGGGAHGRAHGLSQRDTHVSGRAQQASAHESDMAG